MLEKDILDSFRAESNELLTDLGRIVQRLEQEHATFPAELLAEFAQKIDRIMGAAKTVSITAPDHAGLIWIGRITELCKLAGYKAAEKRQTALLPIFAGFWADTLEHMDSLLKNLEDPAKCAEISKGFSGVLQGRLKWLAQQLAE
ncbi:MAG: hypothetical protein NDJ90_06235 [Oligoflexia bacterium]|nr:hypothetical protein [Oligoflexia bacterium]